MNLMSIIDETSKFYNIDSMILISLFKKALEDELETGELISRISDGNLTFYENYGTSYHSNLLRKIELTSKKKNYFRERFYNYIIDYQQRSKFEYFRKKNIPKDRVVLGRILKIKTSGLVVKIDDVEGFAPNKFLIKQEIDIRKYKIGSEFYWHIYKVRFKKGKLNIILDRINLNITKKIVHDILGEDFNIIDISRKFGVITKIYVETIPNKEKRDEIKMVLNEKIKFIKI